MKINNGVLDTCPDRIKPCIDAVRGGMPKQSQAEDKLLPKS